jgi:hypothetical protein
VPDTASVNLNGYITVTERIVGPGAEAPKAFDARSMYYVETLSLRASGADAGWLRPTRLRMYLLLQDWASVGERER